MRVLLVANRSPWPPTNGASIRQYFILDALKRRGHEVEVYSFAEPEIAAESEARTRALSDGCRIVPIDPLHTRVGAARALLTGSPLSVGYYHSGELHRAVREAHARRPFDTAVVHSGNVVQYVPRSLRGRGMFDMADVDSEKFVDYARDGRFPMRAVYAIEGRRLRRYEFEAIRDFGATYLVAERERELIRDELVAQGLLDKVQVLPNGVDTAFFHPQAHRPLGLDKLPAGEQRFFAPGGPRIVFTGVMDYPPNADAAARFAQQILPRIRAEVPDARFYAVGARPTEAVRALEKLPGVHVTGFVDDARPYFTSADVYVLPLRIARGIQNKALEAMACGCAIVSTQSVASGLCSGAADVRDGRDLLVADEDDAFAANVLALLRDRDRARALGTAARAVVEQHFGWAPIMASFADTLETVARTGAGERCAA
jgi:sugar transferase (PEP-CTERM/EpsH1 system associated)